MAYGIKGKTALVAGAAHGQGRAHALRLAREGADIVAFDLCGQDIDVGYALGTWEELKETAALVEQCGVRCHAARADVRDREALARLADETAGDFPRLDIIVANSGISSCAHFLDVTQQAWDDIIDVNLSGVFKVIQTFLPRMIAGGNGGSIIITSSVAGLKAVPFCAPYVAAKHGLNGLVKVLAVELGQHGIRVNSVNPGAVQTPMTTDSSFMAMARADPETSRLFGASFAAVLPMPDTGFMQPEDISDAVAWLASDESRWVTGAALPVDAGVTVR